MESRSRRFTQKLDALCERGTQNPPIRPNLLFEYGYQQVAWQDMVRPPSQYRLMRQRLRFPFHRSRRGQAACHEAADCAGVI